MGAVDGRVEALDGKRVRARDQHQLRVRVAGRPQLLHHLRRRHHRLVVEVAAALRERLVLDVQCGDARRRVRAHGAHDVELVAEPRVGVGDDRHGDGLRDPGRVDGDEALDHLAHPEQSEIGIAEAAGDAAARGVHRGEARARGEPRRQPVVDARRDNGVAAGEQLSQRDVRSHVATPRPRIASVGGRQWPQPPPRALGSSRFW